MSNKSPDKLKSWLDKLQQESWQLELILTGFAIFLILGLKEPLDDLLDNALRISLASTKFSLIFIQLAAAKAVWFIIITNLIIHLFLRSLWISTIGLRYVSEDIELDQLKLAPVFKRFLERNVKGFDYYIERLEKICSTIFAFTFLIIFVILSCLIYVLILTAFSQLILEPIEKWNEGFGKPITNIFNGLLLISTIIYLIDFVSLGWIKRIKWLAPFYYPVYRLLGWMTLAPLYRPLYYNLIDNRFGRWVGLLIVPYIIIALVGSSVRLQYGKFIPKERTSYQLDNNHYDDLANPQKMSQQVLFFPSIPSKYIENDFLEVFIPYNGVADNDGLEDMCPGLRAAKKEKMYLGGAVNINIDDDISYNIDSIMLCFESIYKLTINDSTYANEDWRIYKHPERKLTGLLAIIDIQHLSRGAHELKVEKYGRDIFNTQGSTEIKWLKPNHIPFWKTTNIRADRSVDAPDSR
jgi:hypothetical protein